MLFIILWQLLFPNFSWAGRIGVFSGNFPDLTISSQYGEPYQVVRRDDGLWSIAKFQM